MLIACTRVSTLEQDVSLQINALQKAGCEHTFQDNISGAKVERPGMQKALN